MKTVYVTNLGHDCMDDVLIKRFTEKNGHLPEDVRLEKLYQALMQIGLLTSSGDGFSFTDTSLEKGRPLNVDDPFGAICVRIDYNPHKMTGVVFGLAEDVRKEIERLRGIDPPDLFDVAMMALSHPNDPGYFSHEGCIQCIRVTIMVAPGTILEKTYWATQFDLMPELAG